MSDETGVGRVPADPKAPDDREWFSVEAFVTELRRRGFPASRGVVYEAVRLGRLPHVRLGRRIAIRGDAVDRLL